MTDKIDLSAVVVPKTLRLNVGKRKEIAYHMASISEAKAIQVYDAETKQDALTKRVVEAVWGGKKAFNAAKKRPKDFYKIGCSIAFTTLTVNSHQTGLDGEETGYVNTNYATFDFAEDGELANFILPYSCTGYGNIVIAEKRDHPLIVKKLANVEKLYLFDEDLERDVLDFIRHEDVISKAGKSLNSSILSALSVFTSVKSLQEDWPAAFEAYFKLYEHEFREGDGTNLPSKHVMKIDAVMQMINDFPDSAAA